MNFEQLVTLCEQTHGEIQKRAIRAVDLSLVIRDWLFGRYLVEFEQNGAPPSFVENPPAPPHAAKVF